MRIKIGGSYRIPTALSLKRGGYVAALASIKAGSYVSLALRTPTAVSMLPVSNTNVTFSGDRRTIIATSSGNVSGSTWPARVLLAEYLEGDGWVSIDNVEGTDCVLALSTASNATVTSLGSHGPLLRLGRSISGSGLFAGEGAVPTQLAGGLGTFAKGPTNKARLRRVGTTVTLDVSFDSGATWETRHTYPTPRSGRLFVHVHPAFYNPDAYTVVNPQIFRGNLTLDLQVPFTKVTADGNSLTAVAGPGGGWPARYQVLPDAVAAGLTVGNFAVSGQTITQMLSDQAAQILPVANSGVMVVFEDRNEFVVNATSVAAHADKLAQYLDALPAGVKKIIVFRGSVVDGSNPAAGTHSANLLAYWQATYASKANATVVLSDYWQLSDSSNTAYFDPDGTHYVVAGASVAASAIRDAHTRLTA